MNHPVTLKDIARDCGYSVSVVSRALNPRPDQAVNAKTKEIIERSMRKLHYRRNNAACLLQRGRNVSIGVFLPYYHEFLINELVVGISRAALANDFQCHYYFGQKREDYLEFLSHLNDIGGSGVLTYPVLEDYGDDVMSALERYSREGGSTVMIHGHGVPPGIESICIEETGGALAAARLAEDGCRRFICMDELHVLEKQNSRPLTSARLSVFLETLRGMGREGEAFTVRVEGYHQGSQEDFACLIRSLSPDVPTGIFATTDYLALSFMLELAKAGLGGELGRHLFLIGYDDNPMASMITPGLTTIHQPFHALGTQGIELLISKIMGRDYPRRRLIPELVIRGTA